MYNERKLKNYCSNSKKGTFVLSMMIIAVMLFATLINVSEVNAETEEFDAPKVTTSIHLDENTWVNEPFYVQINGKLPNNMYSFIDCVHSFDLGKTWSSGSGFYYSKDNANASIVAKAVYKLDETGETVETKTSEPIKFKYDGTKPTINGVAMNGMTATVNAHDATSGVVAYGVSNSPNILPKTWSNSKTINIGNGGLCYFYAKDAAGNVSEAKSLTVKPKNVNINKCKIIQLGSNNGVDGEFSFSGGLIKPHPDMEYNGYELKKDVDYTLSWKNNMNVGTGTLIIKGKGGFYGTLNRNFKFINLILI